VLWMHHVRRDSYSSGRTEVCVPEALWEIPALCLSYVCMYVRMYVCIYLCMYVYIYVCMYVCMYEDGDVRTCSTLGDSSALPVVCMYVCMCVCMCMRTEVCVIWGILGLCLSYVCMYVCVCVCV
jgi:hypothetical protein